MAVPKRLADALSVVQGISEEKGNAEGGAGASRWSLPTAVLEGDRARERQAGGDDAFGRLAMPCAPASTRPATLRAGWGRDWGFATEEAEVDPV